MYMHKTSPAIKINFARYISLEFNLRSFMLEFGVREDALLG